MPRLLTLAVLSLSLALACAESPMGRLSVRSLAQSHADPHASHSGIHRALSVLERYEAQGRSPFRALFSGAEHRNGSNNNGFITVPLLNGSSNADAADVRSSFAAHSFRFSTATGLDLGTYGDVVATGGDYFGPQAPTEVVCLGQTDSDLQQRFRFVFDQMYELQNNPNSDDYLKYVRAMFDEEVDAINSGKYASPADAYAALGYKSVASPLILQHGYLQLALSNNDHFANSNCARRAYRGGHMAAIATAQDAGRLLNNASFTFSSASQEQRASALSAARTGLERAYLMNAFADHFLTDMFAAGHMRTPRVNLLTTCADSLTINGYSLGLMAGSLAAKWQHDEDNRNGLLVTNQRGDRWMAFGDNNFFDIRNAANAAMLQEAVNVSRSEVYAAFNGGNYTEGALALLPALSLGGPNLFSANNTCGLYRANPVTNGTLMRSPRNTARPNAWLSTHGQAIVGSDPLAVDCVYTEMTKSDCPQLVTQALQQLGTGVGGEFEKWLADAITTVYMRYDTTQQAWVSTETVPDASPSSQLRASSFLSIVLAVLCAAVSYQLL